MIAPTKYVVRLIKAKALYCDNKGYGTWYSLFVITKKNILSDCVVLFNTKEEGQKIVDRDKDKMIEVVTLQEGLEGLFGEKIAAKIILPDNHFNSKWTESNQKNCKIIKLNKKSPFSNPNYKGIEVPLSISSKPLPKPKQTPRFNIISQIEKDTHKPRRHYS